MHGNRLSPGAVRNPLSRLSQRSLPGTCGCPRQGSHIRAPGQRRGGGHRRQDRVSLRRPGYGAGIRQDFTVFSILDVRGGRNDGRAGDRAVCRRAERRSPVPGQGQAPARTCRDLPASGRHTRKEWSPCREHDCSAPARSAGCVRQGRYGFRSQSSRTDRADRPRRTCLGSPALARACPTLSLLMSAIWLRPSSKPSACKTPA